VFIITAPSPPPAPRAVCTWDVHRSQPHSREPIGVEDFCDSSVSFLSAAVGRQHSAPETLFLIVFNFFRIESVHIHLTRPIRVVRFPTGRTTHVDSAPIKDGFPLTPPPPPQQQQLSNMRVRVVCVAGVVPPGDEGEAEGPVEAAHGEVQRRGGAGLWRSGQVRSFDHTDSGDALTLLTDVCLLVEEPRTTTHSPFRVHLLFRLS